MEAATVAPGGGGCAYASTKHLRRLRWVVAAPIPPSPLFSILPQAATEAVVPKTVRAAGQHKFSPYSSLVFLFPNKRRARFFSMILWYWMWYWTIQCNIKCLGSLNCTRIAKFMLVFAKPLMSLAAAIASYSWLLTVWSVSTVNITKIGEN